MMQREEMEGNKSYETRGAKEEKIGGTKICNEIEWRKWWRDIKERKEWKAGKIWEGVGYKEWIEEKGKRIGRKEGKEDDYVVKRKWIGLIR